MRLFLITPLHSRLGYAKSDRDNQRSCGGHHQTRGLYRALDFTALAENCPLDFLWKPAAANPPQATRRPRTGRIGRAQFKEGLGFFISDCSFGRRSPLMGNLYCFLPPRAHEGRKWGQGWQNLAPMLHGKGAHCLSLEVERCGGGGGGGGGVRCSTRCLDKHRRRGPSAERGRELVARSRGHPECDFSTDWLKSALGKTQILCPRLANPVS